MTTDQTNLPTESREGAGPPRRSWWPTFWLAIGAILLFLIAYHARIGAVSPRIRNPEAPPGPAARPVEPLLGFDHWVSLLQIFTIVSMVILITFCVVQWRRHPKHPYLLMTLATTLIVWQDPIMNWAPFAVYNPDLAHWPEDWPLVSLSPTVEPFLVIGYAMFYFAPFFPANWVLQRLQAKRPADAFVSRHPLISLAGLILVFGFIFDMMLEVSLVRTGMYIYSQAIPFGTIFGGSTYQFPLLWESTFVCLVMVPAGVLVYRDDTGRTVAEKLANKVRFFPTKPALGMFVMMFIIINISYFAYGFAFQLIKVSGFATSVACPWPYPEAKVYDPQGVYEKAGAEGPYSVGIWSTWMSGQPDGRPNVEKPANGGPCTPEGNDG